MTRVKSCFRLFPCYRPQVRQQPWQAQANPKLQDQKHARLQRALLPEKPAHGYGPVPTAELKWRTALLRLLVCLLACLLVL